MAVKVGANVVVGASDDGVVVGASDGSGRKQIIVVVGAPPELTTLKSLSIDQPTSVG